MNKMKNHYTDRVQNVEEMMFEDATQQQLGHTQLIGHAAKQLNNQMNVYESTSGLTSNQLYQMQNTGTLRESDLYPFSRNKQPNLAKDNNYNTNKDYSKRPPLVPLVTDSHKFLGTQKS